MIPHDTDYDLDCEPPEMRFDYLTPKEVMLSLSIGRNKFYELVNSGKLPAARIGKLWRVKRSDLEALFN